LEGGVSEMDIEKFNAILSFADLRKIKEGEGGVGPIACDPGGDGVGPKTRKEIEGSGGRR
jgi:hypothetical protein